MRQDRRGLRRSRGSWRNLARMLAYFHFRPLRPSYLTGVKDGWEILQLQPLGRGNSFTPGGTSVPEGSTMPVSTSVPGNPLTSLGAFAPRIRSTPGGASAPRSLKIPGDTPVSGEPTNAKGVSAPRIPLTPGGASAPGSLVAHTSTTATEYLSAPGGALRRGVSWPLEVHLYRGVSPNC